MRRCLVLLVSLSLLLWVLPAAAAPAVPVFSRAKTITKAIALTFDDGWSATTSELVRQILKVNGIRATIFPVAGWAKQNQQLMARFVADGHELGNHSVNHPDLTKLSQDRQRSEIAGASDLLQTIAGERYTAWFRPPYGAYNAATLQLARELKLQPVLWSVDSWDWRDIPSTVVVQRVLSGACPGAVVLMHLAGRNTVAALPDIITGLRDAGYAFVTLSELAQMDRGATVSLPEHSVQVVQRGERLQLAPGVVLLAGKAFIPCRAFLEQAGFQVNWEESSQTASFEGHSQYIQIQAGSAVATLNGKGLELHGQAVIIGGRLYAPIRPLAEMLGFDVSWDESSRAVVLK